MDILEKIQVFLDVGNGDGYGNGNGYGYGNGYGNGYGIKGINGMPVYYVDNTPTVITNVRGQLATGFTIRHNTELIPCYIARVGNFFGHGETSHDAMRAARDKYEENRPLSERIDDFVKEFPILDATGTGRRFYEWHHILTGSCEFGRNEFCKAHGVGMDTIYTTGYFLNLVRNDFGGDAIKEVLKRFNNKANEP